MIRRHFLMTAAATMLGGCYGAARPELADVEKRWPPQGRIINAGGLDIHAWDQGSGTPVVLLHGASGNLRDWTWDLGPTSAKRRRAIAFDRPGAGYSQRSPDGGDPAA